MYTIFFLHFQSAIFAVRHLINAIEFLTNILQIYTVPWPEHWEKSTKLEN